ncbi:rRNA-processing protein las1 [Elasticomyces elasticus]|nr:rRNA-processing protein las1 [Elasticomyces elasticus]
MSPWQDESELALIRDWIYPSQAKSDIFDMVTEDNRPEAIAKVNIWTFKSHRTPTAIIATADLTDALLQHQKLARSNDSTRYRSVQFMLAFAFLRFVNSFVDRDIARASNAALATSDVDDEDDDRSQSKAAEMRHRVSHGDVPDIQVLVKHAQEGLFWLRERWWKTNAVGDPAKALRRHHARREQWAEYESGQTEKRS